MGLLEGHWDPGLTVDVSESLEDITKQEVERLQTACAMVLVATQQPRRTDGNREELALDKKRSRRILHPLRQSLVAWGGKERAPTEADKRAGAQVDWPVWLEEQEAWLQARLRYVATWAKASGNLRFGKSAVVRLTQELEWLRYALRD